jgi:four helix bundle protein
MQQAEEMKKRTRAFALRVIRLVRSLPRSDESRVIGGQLLRSGTAVGANYRSACRARSRREFVSRIGVVVEEADDSAFWLDLLVDAGVMPASRLRPLADECGQLVAICAASYYTARRRQTASQ